MNNWERHIKHAWRERIIPDASLEFFLVTPLPEDAAASTLGQLMIFQRAVRFQRSVLISLYGNGYDRGLPHSHAFVMSDRVDLHNVRSLVEAVDDCPPEQPSNVCTLWFGDRPLEPQERILFPTWPCISFLYSSQTC